jgi:hypothetical protein
MKLFDIQPVTGLSDYVGIGLGSPNRCFVVKSAAQLLFVVMLQHHQFKVFNVNTYGDEPEPVKSIGDHAIFVGDRRCVSVTADKFPSVVSNCIYYVKRTNSSLKIYKYDLEAKKVELVSEAIDSLNPNTLSVDNSPFTILQLLSSYTNNIRTSQLTRRVRTTIPTPCGIELHYAAEPGSCWCQNMVEVIDPENPRRKPHCIRACDSSKDGTRKRRRTGS